MTQEDHNDLETFNDDGDEERTEWFDYRLFSGSDGLQGLVEIVRGLCDGASRPRQRARKPKDEESFRASIDCLVSNLAHVVLRWGYPRPLVVSRKSTITLDRNEAVLPFDTFCGCLDLMKTVGLVQEELGAWNVRPTTIQATPLLLSMIRCRTLTFKSFFKSPEDQLVVLKRTTTDAKGRKIKTDWVDFEATAETQGITDRLSKLNEFLKGADLDFIDDGIIPMVHTQHYRELVRYFSIRNHQGIRFDQGGRLYGKTFWLNLPSARRGGLRIDGEPVADLDFKNLGPRIAYVLLGEEPPPGDLYDLTGLLPGYDHSNEDHRKAIKRSFAACLNGGAGGSRAPNRKTKQPGILEPLPKGTSAAKVRKAIFEKHPGFEVLYERASAGEMAVGFEIMFKESCILLSALEQLKDDGVVALPFHDGLMVAQSKAQIAEDALRAASRDVLGVELPVVPKAVAGYSASGPSVLAA